MKIGATFSRASRQNPPRSKIQIGFARRTGDRTVEIGASSSCRGDVRCPSMTSIGGRGERAEAERAEGCREPRGSGGEASRGKGRAHVRARSREHMRLSKFKFTIRRVAVCLPLSLSSSSRLHLVSRRVCFPKSKDRESSPDYCPRCFSL